jgi:hypothetical protein
MTALAAPRSTRLGSVAAFATAFSMYDFSGSPGAAILPPKSTFTEPLRIFARFLAVLLKFVILDYVIELDLTEANASRSFSILKVVFPHNEGKGNTVEGTS